MPWTEIHTAQQHAFTLLCLYILTTWILCFQCTQCSCAVLLGTIYGITAAYFAKLNTHSRAKDSQSAVCPWLSTRLGHSLRKTLTFHIFPFSSIFYFIDSIGKSRGGQSLGSSKSFADMAQLLIVSLILAVRGSEIQADHGCWLFPIVYPSSAGGAGCTLQCVGISRISWIHVNLCYTNLLSRCLVWFINLWGTSPNGRYGKYAVQCGGKRSDNHHHGFPFSLHNVTMSFVFRWQTYWEFRSISGPWAVESMLHIRTDSFVSFLMLGMYLPFPPCGTCWPSRWLLMTTPLPWWTWQVAWELVGETVVSEVTVVRWISTVSRRRDDWWNYVWNCRCKWSM